MENIKIEQLKENEPTPEELGEEFNSRDFFDFRDYLYEIKEKHPDMKINIVANWISVEKTRSAKGLWDQHKDRFNIESITIKATKEQYLKDVNSFQSGVKWEEI